MRAAIVGFLFCLGAWFVNSLEPECDGGFVATVELFAGWVCIPGYDPSEDRP